MSLVHLRICTLAYLHTNRPVAPLGRSRRGDLITGYQILRRIEGESALSVYVENTGSMATTYTDTDVTAGFFACAG